MTPHRPMDSGCFRPPPPVGGACLESAMRHPWTAKQSPFPSAKRPTEALPDDTVSEEVSSSPETPGHPNMDGTGRSDHVYLVAEMDENRPRWAPGALGLLGLESTASRDQRSVEARTVPAQDGPG